MPKITYRTLSKVKKKLTPKQSKFVDKYIETGVGAKAIKEAGYNPKNNVVASVMANENLNKPYIKEAIEEKEADLHQLFKENSILAFNTMLNLMLTANSEKVKQSCAKDLLDRAGYAPTNKQELTGKDGQPLQVENQLLIEFATRARDLISSKENQ